jgi:hypothetical protein
LRFKSQWKLVFAFIFCFRTILMRFAQNGKAHETKTC